MIVQGPPEEAELKELREQHEPEVRETLGAEEHKDGRIGKATSAKRAKVVGQAAGLALSSSRGAKVNIRLAD